MAEKLAHETFACDRCKVKPIVGTRYKCEVCDNFDFCEKCFKIQDHGHPMHPIPKPIKNLLPPPKEEIVHKGCDMLPVIGNCYLCQTCKYFAYCQKCYQIEEHNPAHEFKAVFPPKK